MSRPSQPPLVATASRIATALRLSDLQAGATWRLGQWWCHKLIPPLLVLYATCWVEGRSLSSHWLDIAALLGALVIGAAAVSLINDLTDRSSDARAGKANRLANTSNGVALGLLLPLLIAGAAFAWLWIDRPALLAAYGGAWVTFVLYSVEPIRLKGRGLWGLLADAAGSSLFPCLMAALVVGGSDLLWLIGVTAWSLGYGLRGILIHQIDDLNADRESAVQTFAVVYGADRGRKIGIGMSVPLELAGLAIMLALCGSWIAVLALLGYGVFSVLKVRRFANVPALILKGPRHLFLFQDLYLLIWPILVLIALSWRHPADVWALVAHGLIFAPVHVEALREFKHLIWRG